MILTLHLIYVWGKKVKLLKWLCSNKVVPDAEQELKETR